AQGGAVAALLAEDNADCVNPVGEIVRQHRRGDNGADPGRNLEGETDREAVEKTVHRQATRAKGAALPELLGTLTLVAVRRNGPVEDHVTDETAGDERQHRRHVMGGGG